MLDEIIPAIPLPRIEKGCSGLPFSCSLYGVLFLIWSSREFSNKKLIFPNPIFSIPYHLICDYVAVYI